jgi:hypothetical protein
LDHPGGFGHDPVAIKRRAIADVFRSIDLLRDPEGRRMCIEFSEEEIGEPILGVDPDNHATRDDDELLRLVDHLLAREVAMWVFVYTITDIYSTFALLPGVG